MLAKRGITSFFNNWDVRGLIPEFEFTEFKSVVYAVCADVGADVRSVTQRGVTPNFHTAIVAYRQHAISILGHSTYPVFAFAEPFSQEECKLRFIDHEVFSVAIPRLFPHIAIANTQEVSQQISNVDLSQLDATELEQIKYWKPQTIGEVAFNWWD